MSAAESIAVAIEDAPFVSFPRAMLDLDFGSVDAGLGASRKIQVWNRGKLEAVVEVSQSPQVPFALDPSAALALPAGERISLKIDFIPTQVGTFAGTVRLVTGDSSALVTLRGKGIQPVPPIKRCDLVAGPTSTIDFGTVEPTQPKILNAYLQNNGDDGCVIDFAPTLTAFQILDPETGSTFSSFQRKALQIRFAPSEFGKPYSEVFTAIARGMGPTATLTFKGTSAAACPRVPNDGGCPVVAQDIFLNTKNELWQRGQTGQLVRMSEFSVLGEKPSTMTDIAVSPSGDMFGVAGPIYAIDPTTGACREVTKPTTTIAGLGFLPDGRMITAGAGLFLIDLTTVPPTETPIPGTSSLTTSGDVVALSNDRILWTVEGGDTLVDVRLDAGTVTVVGSIGSPGVYGLAYDIDGLHGFTNGGQELIIDPQTASVLSSTSMPAAWMGAGSRAP